MAPPNSLPSRQLGKDGPMLPRIGLGLMNSCGSYGNKPDEESRLALLDKAWELGEVHWDTGELPPISLSFTTSSTAHCMC